MLNWWLCFLCLKAMVSLTLRLMVMPGQLRWRNCLVPSLCLVPGSKNTMPLTLLPFLSIARPQVTTSTPQIVKVLSDENSTIKRRVKEAIAIKQRKTSLNMDEGLDLPAIYNPLLGILLCNLPPHNDDEIRVIRTKNSFCFLFFRSEF